MTSLTNAATVELVRMRRRAGDFVELAKPRVVAMVLITTAVGFYLGNPDNINYVRFLQTLVGTALAAAGAMALNQYLERDVDAKMRRTEHRPLPDKRLRPGEAMVFGTGLTLIGLLYLTLAVNWLSGAVTATTAVTYLFLYTPMKQRTPLATVVGAVPGALPPLTGWTAARGEFGVEAWVLFGILFLWQLPHSLAIAQLYREDYARGGFRLLPVVEKDGRITGRQVVVNCLALLVVGLLPTVIGLAGPVYFLVALVLGIAYLAYGVAFLRARTQLAARQLLYVSLLYLPALLIAMAADRWTYLGMLQ